MADESLAFLAAAEQGRLVRDRKISPVELTELYLRRIERLDGKLRSYITVCGDLALEMARGAEEEIGRGRYRGALHGLPVAVKDQMHIAGVRTTGGSRIYADFVPAEDSTAIARLRRAGVVWLGKLNTMEFHMGYTLDWPYGTPRNPWNLDRSPGGSSSGSGSAVAAALCSASLGEDTGGSIRNPAASCGVTGFKPTWSRVSRQGVFPLAWPMDCMGPLARSVEDCAIVLRDLAGHDPKDPTSSREPVPDYVSQLAGDLRGVRVGVLEEMVDENVEPAGRAAVDQAVRLLAHHGAVISRVSIPIARAAQLVHTAVVDPEATSYHRDNLRTRYLDYDFNSRVRMMVGTVLPAGMHTMATRARAAIGAQVLDVLKGVDVLVGATAGGGAGKIQTESNIRSKEEAFDALWGPKRYGLRTIFNMSGGPAISVPCGFNPEGLPLGFHVGGRPFEDGLVLKVAHVYQQATDWHRKRPPMA